MASPEFDGTFNHPHTKSRPNGKNYMKNADRQKQTAFNKLWPTLQIYLTHKTPNKNQISSTAASLAIFQSSLRLSAVVKTLNHLLKLDAI